MIGIAIVMWIAVVVLRTPALGINPERIGAIAISAGSMLILGIHWERIRRAKQDDDEEEDER